ncbi:DegV family protein [Chloroflexota bacterium]
MVVKVVTDSTSDISPEVANALGITVVPVYVRFGDEVYRDGVDISSDEFYQKLTDLFVHPATSQPTPEDFARVYSDCAKKADGIISIHISDKVSGVYNSALQGKKMTKGECQIEVVDSYVTSVGLALTVMAAAKLASAGGSLLEVFEETRRVISQVYIIGLVNTMKYLVLGRRLNKAAAVAAGILDIKPLLAFKDGEIVRAGLVHTYSQGIDRLYKFVESNPDIQDLAIAYSTEPEQARQLKARLGSCFPEEDIYVTQLGAGLGVHVGPGGLIVALRRRG